MGEGILLPEWNYRKQILQPDYCLLLADLSLSTDAYASDHARVIDVIRHASALLARQKNRQGLRPFCVTIDREANDYLPHLFGIGGYALIREPEDLPRELPLFYAQMTC